MKIHTHACDVCAIQKRETNHWFLVTVDESEHLVVEKWNEETAEIAGVKHVCGLEHLMKLAGRWAETGKLEGRAP